MSLVSESAAHIPGLRGLYVRQALYQRLLLQCGTGVHFGYQTLLSKQGITIGDQVYIGRFCTIGRVTIGDETRIADGVQLLSGQHHHGSSQEGVHLTSVRYEVITIGKGAWIGANAVVMADVGDGAIVGAGCVVTKPVEPGATVIGVPARPIHRPTQPRQAA
ncbi:MAG: acyltransferase [Planctomycetota bacterium]